MDHGKQIDSGRPAGCFYAIFQLLDRALGGQGISPWVDLRGSRAFSIEVLGLTSGHVVLRATNFPAPTDAYTGQEFGEPIKGDGFVLIEAAVAYLRAELVGQDPEQPVTVLANVVH